jgi:hypothetical protein
MVARYRSTPLLRTIKKGSCIDRNPTASPTRLQKQCIMQQRTQQQEHSVYIRADVSKARGEERKRAISELYGGSSRDGTSLVVRHDENNGTNRMQHGKGSSILCRASSHRPDNLVPRSGILFFISFSLPITFIVPSFSSAADAQE